ncbi:MAG: ATP-binding protein [Firmicutes bacterium]|nr:ATP-binding protein [Bacillota bacterium]
MLGKIISIEDNIVTVQLAVDLSSQMNLINLHVVFEDGKTKVVGEIKDLTKTTAKIAIVGELIGDIFLAGFNKKPSFKSNIRMIQLEELAKILGDQKVKDNSQVYFGVSTVYENYRVNVDVNKFFSNHFAILGNTGSGKSFTVSRLIQNLFTGSSYVPLNSNIFLFDAYGEYSNAFCKLQDKNPRVRYKTITTDVESASEILQIPLWLLDVDDVAQLLQVETPNQLPIIEKALRLVKILSSDNPNVKKHKNDIIARAILDILLSGKESGKIRDQVTAVLSNFNTEELNLNSEIREPGYIRTLKQCLFTDKTGKMQDMELVVDFVNQFIIEDLETIEVQENPFFTLKDLENALDFALISEGILKSDKVFDYANVLSVRLHSLVNSEYAKYFECTEMLSKETFIRRLITSIDGKKAQIVNFNISHVDDRMAKAITKIISHILFTFNVESKQRGKIPFHIIIEEAHRYVQNDTDAEILGYNIFDRITKEGRKYGVLLGLITQRPSELSETSISQCSNFIILRTLHPRDLSFIKNMVPSVSSDIIEQLKSLQAGNCIAFGTAFKIPVAMKFDKADPEPLSNNVDLISTWY